MLCEVCRQLTPRELCVVGQVCTFFCEVARSDTLWERHVRAAWADKVFVPEHSRAHLEAGRFRLAYSSSHLDAKRTHLTVAELCAAPWYGRMKSSAGAHFTDTDPWWLGGRLTHTMYRPDGTYARFLPRQAPTAGGGSPPSMGAGVVSGHDRPGSAQSAGQQGGVAAAAAVAEAAAEGAPTVGGSWRFVSSCCGMEGPRGSFVRIRHNRLGRETPSKVVARHPHNWGWVLDGCWHVQTSWPMPPREGPRE
eukprot:SAG25_NODE_76_length_16934_cov_51.463202_18_plen_250_part_00